MIEDAVQDALLQLLLARRGRVIVRDEVGFCLHVMRRRLIDRLRRRIEVSGRALGDVSASEQVVVDWAAELEGAGWPLSPTSRELLARIQAGVRSTKGLARALGRDAKTIKERRAVLLAFLRRVLVDSGGTPPLNDFKGTRYHAAPPNLMDFIPCSSQRESRWLP